MVEMRGTITAANYRPERGVTRITETDQVVGFAKCYIARPVERSLQRQQVTKVPNISNRHM